MPILPVSAVVDAFDVHCGRSRARVRRGSSSPGRPSEPFGFRKPPGPRAADGSRVDRRHQGRHFHRAKES